jgi:hypothetical protein
MLIVRNRDRPDMPLENSFWPPTDITAAILAQSIPASEWESATMEEYITGSDAGEIGRPTKRRRELLAVRDTDRGSWRFQTEEEVPVTIERGFVPTKDMPTMAFVEEVHTRDSRLQHMPIRVITCSDRQIEWRLCGQQGCYGCYFKENAVASMETTTDRGETENIIGDWTKRAHWEK